MILSACSPNFPGSEFTLQAGDIVCFLPEDHHFTLTGDKFLVAPGAGTNSSKKRKRESEKPSESDPPKKKGKGEESPPPAKKKKAVSTEEQKRQEEEDLKLAMSLQPRECTLCLESIDVDFLQVLGCGHEFCRDCLATYFQTNIEDKSFPLTCPSVDCRKDVTDSGTF